MGKAKTPVIAAAIDVPDQWAEIDRIRVARGIDVDKPAPKGSFSAVQYAERYSLLITTAIAQLDRMAREGTLSKGRASVIDNWGRARVRTVYWPQK